VIFDHPAFFFFDVSRTFVCAKLAAP